jgi:subtilase family serine protease
MFMHEQNNTGEDSMKFSVLFKVLSLLIVTLFSVAAMAQAGSTGMVSEQQLVPRAAQAGNVFVPESSKEKPAGFAHTTYVLASEDGNKPAPTSVPTPRVTVSPSVTNSALVLTQMWETPASMGCLYVKNPITPGCVPSVWPTLTGGGPSALGYGAIAIVDAFDNPSAATDVATFNAAWPLAATNFTKIYANGNGSCTTPPVDAGWAMEESLDIEWAHVFAPNAAIILVEACSNSYTDLFYAEQVAFNYIVANYPAGGQVTNSWAGSEFSGQTADDIFFADYNYNSADGWKTPILAFASAGDDGYGALYPSTNPWLISAGGTSVFRKATNDYYYSEGCWSGSGGGVSAFESWQSPPSIANGMGPWADFQYKIFGQVARTTPDLAFNADPNSGVYVYSGYNGGWYVVGGTSVSSPSLASIINRANNRLGSITLNAITGNNGYFAAQENNLLYSQLGTYTAYKTNFYDPTTGSNGGPKVGKGYDECTGVGTPRGLLGK